MSTVTTHELQLAGGKIQMERDVNTRELDTYIKHLTLEGLSAHTIRGRRDAIRRFARFIDPVYVGDATHEQVYAYRASLTVSPDVVVNYISHLHCRFDWAVRTGRRADNPADGIPLPRLTDRMPRPVGEAALMDILAAAPRRIRLWLILAAWAGLRAQEIAWLRCQSIHLDADPPWLLVTRDTAKGQRERFVQLCDFAAAELRAANLGTRGWAFTRRDGQPGPNTPHRLSNMANKHIHDCGYPDTLHALRHRFLTQVQAACHDLRVTQQLAGHRSPATTAVYTLVTSAQAHAAVQAIPVPGPRRVRALQQAG